QHGAVFDLAHGGAPDLRSRVLLCETTNELLVVASELAQGGQAHVDIRVLPLGVRPRSEQITERHNVSDECGTGLLYLKGDRHFLSRRDIMSLGRSFAAAALVLNAMTTNSSTARDVLPFPAAERTLANGLQVIVVPTGFPNIIS